MAGNSKENTRAFKTNWTSRNANRGNDRRE